MVTEGIKNIIFDMGNILIGFRWKDMLENERGLDPERARAVARAVFKSDLWEQYDLGDLTPSELVNEFEKREPELFEDIKWFMDNAEYMGVDRPEIWKLVNKLKKAGYKLYVLSNYSEHLYSLHAAAVEKAIDFDGRLISYQVHVSKPDRRIYELLLEKYGLKAGECFFIDDVSINVEAAREAGLNAETARSEEEVNRILAEFLKAKAND